jgi:hypothetical protein
LPSGVTTVLYPGIVVGPTTVPYQPVPWGIAPVIVDLDPAPTLPYDPAGNQNPTDTDDLIRRLEEILKRAKQQAASPERREAAPPAEEENADIDTVRFRRLEPKKSDVE